jgi:putative SOS response-associated peptidase YedK
MPVVLAPETWPTWLGEEPANEVRLKALLAPYPSEEMVCWPVSPRRQRQEQRSGFGRTDSFAVIR